MTEQQTTGSVVDNGPYPWQCANNAPSPYVDLWCFLEDGHKGECSWMRNPTFAARPLVKYSIGVHGSKESAWEAARDAGITEDELQGRFQDLRYIGSEVIIDVTVDRVSGQITEKVRP